MTWRSNIRHDNTLAHPLPDNRLQDRVDCLVTNPLFGEFARIDTEAASVLSHLKQELTTGS